MPNIPQTVRTIALQFAIDGTEKAAGQCEYQSRSLAQGLCDIGFRAQAFEGQFRPTTAPATWNRWCREDHADFGQTRFGHCWVEVDDFILDPTAAQFGEEPLLVVSISDARYRSPKRLLATADEPYSFAIPQTKQII